MDPGTAIQREGRRVVGRYRRVVKGLMRCRRRVARCRGRSDRQGSLPAGSSGRSFSTVASFKQEDLRGPQAQRGSMGFRRQAPNCPQRPPTFCISPSRSPFPVFPASPNRRACPASSHRLVPGRQLNTAKCLGPRCHDSSIHSVSSGPRAPGTSFRSAHFAANIAWLAPTVILQVCTASSHDETSRRHSSLS